MQVTALMAAPFLLDHPKVGDMFPADAIARAKKLSAMFPGGVGAYTDSRGAPGVRQEVADFLKQRDGYPADPNVSTCDSCEINIRWGLSAVQITLE